MINGKTFYQVLGVLNTAEDIVIRAAYRSLSNRYHPDKWAGDKTIAHERMSEMNVAFDVLGDMAKRKKYDNELKEQGKYDDAADIDNDTSDFEGIYTEHSDAWDVAINFFPNLNALHERLRKINASLAYTFKTMLVERKEFNLGAQLAERLELEFMIKYFGQDESVRHLAKFLIENEARPAESRSAAKELNGIVNVMGGSVDGRQVKHFLRKNYPNVIAHYESSTLR